MALTGILLSGEPGQQASVAVAVLFMSYVAQQRLRPFVEVDRNDVGVDADADNGDEQGKQAAARGSVWRVLMSFRRRLRASTATSSNTLESTFLITAMLVLMAGMVFISGGFSVGSVGYSVLTWVVTVIVVLSTCCFLALVVLEVYKSIAHHKRHLAERAAEADRLEQAMMSRVGRTSGGGGGGSGGGQGSCAADVGVLKLPTRHKGVRFAGAGTAKAAAKVLGVSFRNAGRRLTRFGRQTGDADAAVVASLGSEGTLVQSPTRRKGSAAVGSARRFTAMLGLFGGADRTGGAVQAAVDAGTATAASLPQVSTSDGPGTVTSCGTPPVGVRAPLSPTDSVQRRSSGYSKSSDIGVVVVTGSSATAPLQALLPHGTGDNNSGVDRRSGGGSGDGTSAGMAGSQNAGSAVSVAAFSTLWSFQSLMAGPTPGASMTDPRRRVSRMLKLRHALGASE